MFVYINNIILLKITLIIVPFKSRIYGSFVININRLGLKEY